VSFERREQMTQTGDWCSWEAESLAFDQLDLWTATPPDEENWCRAPGESSRTVDILGRDGPYLSVRLTEWSCCPDHATARCVTYDLRTGQPATLEQYDEKHAARRWERARAKVPAGYVLTADAFVVGDRHVRFCAVRGDDVVEIREQ
jgi:hypothetical protein